MEISESILTFWFGTQPDDGLVARQQAKLWWSKNPESDQEIRNRYELLVEQAGRGELDEWAIRPRSLLALILLTDQFPRNIFRNAPKAFQFDPIARRLCLAGLEQGLDLLLRPIERVFFYLPLEHAESLSLQDRSVELYISLCRQVPPTQLDVFNGYLDYALRHRHVIERFGRFPHRNSILNRQSTVEERQFLAEPGSSF
ncbi:MAG: hypothetical protein JWQ23_1851 [Herminiimonas sp.]|nr:hypothetical protein [Herminiimonas sp.]